MTSPIKQTLAVLALVSAATAPHGPAAAAPGGPSDPQQLLKLSYSRTGPWTDNLPTPLFGVDDGPLAPGDAEPKTFYVFGTPGTKAALRLTCSVSGENAFAERLELEYQVGGEGFRSCESQHQAFEVTGRDPHPVDVRMEFADQGEGQTGDMNQSATYSVTVTLSQLPQKGGGKPQVLGTQTLITSDADVDATAATSGPTTSTSDSGGEQSAAPRPSGKDKGKASPAKTTNASAVLPDPNASLTESAPLIGGLIVAGALLAGFRRRRREAD